MPHAVISQLSAGYGGEVVLHAVELALGDGECLWLQGNNGSGKSTLLKALVGLSEVYAGRLNVDGLDIAFGPDAVRRGVLWYVPQKAPLFENLTAFEHVALLAHARTLNDREVWEQAILILKVFDLSEPVLRSKKGRELSFGQRKAIALVLGVCSDPQILLLDEPFAGMSGHFVEQAHALLDRRAGRKSTILVEHREEAARSLAQRKAVIDGGRIVALGEANE